MTMRPYTATQPQCVTCTYCVSFLIPSLLPPAFHSLLLRAFARYRFIQHAIRAIETRHVYAHVRRSHERGARDYVRGNGKSLLLVRAILRDRRCNFQSYRRNLQTRRVASSIPSSPRRYPLCVMDFSSFFRDGSLSKTMENANTRLKKLPSALSIPFFLYANAGNIKREKGYFCAVLRPISIIGQNNTCRAAKRAVCFFKVRPRARARLGYKVKIVKRETDKMSVK